MRPYFFLIPSLLMLSCFPKDQQLKEVSQLPLDEVSGIELFPGDDIVWAIEDSGNKNIVYGLSLKGEIIHELQLKGAENKDWEDIASDTQGNLYVGDFGNNSNKRKDLVLYKINRENVKDGEISEFVKTTFYFPEQHEFPPKKSERFYDVEAFVVHNGSFYLFTKNRSAKFDGTFMVYKVPCKEGDYAAQLLATLKSCSVYSKCAVTGADISPDGKTIVLLSSDKVWQLTDFENDSFKQENLKMFELGHNSQKEGICFKDDATLLLADERDKKTGGYLYEVKPADLKAKH